MAHKILLSIVVPTHNSQETIVNLLNSINDSKFNQFNDLEAVIVDDGSKDETIMVIKELIPQLKFTLRLNRLRRNLGPAHARNLGVKKTRGKYILFLDSDVVLLKNTLNNVFKALKEGRNKAFTGIWHYRQKTKKFFPQFKAMRDWTYWFVEREKNFRYYLFSTRIACIEKRLFNQIGGFNTNYDEATVEDIELTYRIEKQNKIKFCPDFKVFHEFEDFLPIAIKYFKRSRDWIRLYQKRLRFDPVATSKKEALKSITANLFLLFLFLTLIVPFFIYPAVLAFVFFSLLEAKFWRFLIEKKGVVFFLKSIPVALVLYLIINLGAAYGLLLSLQLFNQD